MFCSKCGSSIQDGHKFCMNCGAPVSQVEKPQTQSTMQEMKKQPQSAPREVKSQKKGKKKAVTVVLIVVAALLVIMVALLLVKIFVLDGKQDSDSDSVWSNIEDDSSEGKSTVSDEEISSLLGDTLNGVLEEKGNITELERELRYARDVQDAEGVTGALIQDISGDGVEDLVVAYAEENCLYADVYTVEEGEVVQKGDHLLGAGYFADTTGNMALGGVYIKETADGWVLTADSWLVANLFADGVVRDVKAVLCKEHSYDKAADFTYAGSAPEETEIQDGKAAAESIGMTNIQDPLAGPFFITDQNVTAICVFHDEVEPISGNALEQIGVGDTFGTFYSAAVTDENYKADAAAFSTLIIEYQKFEIEYQKKSEELSLEDSGYILPQSADRKLTAEDLKDIKDDKWLLKVARNEIFARYGRKFQDEKLQEYFNEKDWYEPIYEPDEFDESMVSDLEMSNAKFIKDYEDKLK